jgi:dUTPase
MVLNFTKLDKDTVDPEQISSGKPAFRVFSNKSYRLQPLERAEISTGIMLFGSPDLVVKVFPNQKILLEHGAAGVPRLISEGEEIKISFVNVAVPDFLYLKSKSLQAHSALFGSHNTFEVNKGDEVATILIEKSLENLSLREII